MFMDNVKVIRTVIRNVSFASQAVPHTRRSYYQLLYIVVVYRRRL